MKIDHKVLTYNVCTNRLAISVYTNNHHEIQGVLQSLCRATEKIIKKKN